MTPLKKELTHEVTIYYVNFKTKKLIRKEDYKYENGILVSPKSELSVVDQYVEYSIQKKRRARQAK